MCTREMANSREWLMDVADEDWHEDCQNCQIIVIVGGIIIIISNNDAGEFRQAERYGFGILPLPDVKYYYYKL